MKTAVSLPDELFRRCDELARQLGIPRSQLYARALRQYLEKHSPGHITAALDAVYEGVDSSLDADLAAAQARAVGEEAR